MRVLILGAGGMLGHKLWQVFCQRFDAYATVRKGYQEYESYNLFDLDRLFVNIDALDFDVITSVIKELKPHVVMNCIGVIKQLPTARDPVVAIEINALFPHRLAKLCNASGIRLIHFSTDCVFSGNSGNYNEEDDPDPLDMYGRSKLIGEVSTDGSLTLRTSIIGRELGSQTGLLEWFLAQEGTSIQGYSNAVFSGFTTQALAIIMGDIVDSDKNITGLYHLSSEAINKHDLLVKLKELLGLDIEIEPYEEYHCDRSLDSTKLRNLMDLTPPGWEQMLQELVLEESFYRLGRHDSGS